MLNRLRAVAGFVVLLSLVWLAMASPDDTAPARIKATNTVQLRDAVGQQVTVYGRVARTSTSSGSKHQFLNFYGDELSVICFAEDVSNFDGSGPAQLYNNKDVEITGELERYRNKLQIKLRKPSQIKIVDAQSPPTEPPSVPEKFELKRIGADAWLSPAGLKYEGRDPQGLTRVEHVLRHARDIPDRDGPHGVFDGEKDRVFAVIDEAWNLAQKNRVRPEVERDRSTYLIPMGRRIGYLGGRTGATREHPPLSKLFLVIETRSKNVITAFPRVDPL